jgi:hypothetical protein
MKVDLEEATNGSFSHEVSWLLQNPSSQGLDNFLDRGEAELFRMILLTSIGPPGQEMSLSMC